MGHQLFLKLASFLLVQQLTIKSNQCGLFPEAFWLIEHALYTLLWGYAASNLISTSLTEHAHYKLYLVMSLCKQWCIWVVLEYTVLPRVHNKRREESIERRISRVLNVCGESRARNVSVGQSYHTGCKWPLREYAVREDFCQSYKLAMAAGSIVAEGVLKCSQRSALQGNVWMYVHLL